MGGVLRSGTLGGIRGVDGNCVRQTDGSAGAVLSSSGMVEFVNTPNIIAPKGL